MKPKHETILAQWLRAATPDERERVASLAGTSVIYLYSLAACRREPRVGLAVRLVEAAGEVAREGLPALSVEGLAAMCAVEGLE
jgi:hypothetical protein